MRRNEPCRKAPARSVSSNPSEAPTSDKATNPMVYLPNADDRNTIYVFACNSAASSNPDWYRNLIASGQ